MSEHEVLFSTEDYDRHYNDRSGPVLLTLEIDEYGRFLVKQDFGKGYVVSVISFSKVHALADALMRKLDALELEALPPPKEAPPTVHFPTPGPLGGTWFEVADPPPNMPPWLSEDKDD